MLSLVPTDFQVLNSACPDALHEMVSANSECWDSSKTLRSLAEGDYFKENGGELLWPDGMRPFLDESSSLGLIAREESDLAVSSLGALFSYLKQCQLDQVLPFFLLNLFSETFGPRNIKIVTLKLKF